MSKTGDKSSLGQTLRPVVVLVVTCVVAGALLGFVHAQTAPVAEANAERKAQETYAALVPGATSFEDVEGSEDIMSKAEGTTAVLSAVDTSGELVGYIVVAQAKGYGGQVPLAVAFDTEGKVTNITAMSNDETPGLGTRIANSSYIGQYVGRSAQEVSEGEIDLISGATISSRAALTAFNTAVEAYQEVS